KLAPLALAIASGAVLTTAYPPRNLSLVVWFWLIPLLIALWSTGKSRSSNIKSRLKSGFILGCVAGLAFFIPTLAWVRHSSRVINGAVDDRWMGWPTELMGWSAVAALCGYL